MMEDGETRTVTLSYRDKLLGYNGCGQAFEEDPEEFAKDQEFVYGDDYIGEALKEKQSKSLGQSFSSRGRRDLNYAICGNVH